MRFRLNDHQIRQITEIRPRTDRRKPITATASEDSNINNKAIPPPRGAGVWDTRVVLVTVCLFIATYFNTVISMKIK